MQIWSNFVCGSELVIPRQSSGRGTPFLEPLFHLYVRVRVLAGLNHVFGVAAQWLHHLKHHDHIDRLVGIIQQWILSNLNHMQHTI